MEANIENHWFWTVINNASKFFVNRLWKGRLNEYAKNLKSIRHTCQQLVSSNAIGNISCLDYYLFSTKNLTSCLQRPSFFGPCFNRLTIALHAIFSLIARSVFPDKYAPIYTK